VLLRHTVHLPGLNPTPIPSTSHLHLIISSYPILAPTDTTTTTGISTLLFILVPAHTPSFPPATLFITPCYLHLLPDHQPPTSSPHLPSPRQPPASSPPTTVSIALRPLRSQSRKPIPLQHTSHCIAYCIAPPSPPALLLPCFALPHLAPSLSACFHLQTASFLPDILRLSTLAPIRPRHIRCRNSTPPPLIHRRLGHLSRQL